MKRSVDASCDASRLSPARAYARLMALATLLDPERSHRAREAATVLLDAAETTAESEAA